MITEELIGLGENRFEKYIAKFQIDLTTIYLLMGVLVNVRLGVILFPRI